MCKKASQYKRLGRCRLLAHLIPDLRKCGSQPIYKSNDFRLADGRCHHSIRRLGRSSTAWLSRSFCTTNYMIAHHPSIPRALARPHVNTCQVSPLSAAAAPSLASPSPSSCPRAPSSSGQARWWAALIQQERKSMSVPAVVPSAPCQLYVHARARAEIQHFLRVHICAPHITRRFI